MTKKITGLILFLAIFSCQKKPVSIDLDELTISQIHSAYERGDYTSEELVRAYIERIENYDPATNALTIINPEALTIARQLDEEFDSDEKLRPLHGIPIIVKDNINTKGLPTTAGSWALKDFVPDEDAFIINKLVAAGAIIIAKSNMAEWAFSPMHSESSTAGTTRNPYNLEHVPAGSSGGTAAAVASNFGAVGLGTDTGNSIRGPSSHCGLVGFRTTLGLISRSGIVPLLLRNDVVGPMCRTVEDAARVMEVMTGYDREDPITKYGENNTKKDYQQFLLIDGLKGARIGVLRSLSEDRVDPEVKTLFEQALLDMKALGAELVDPFEVVDFDTLKQNQWCSTFRSDVEAYLSKYVNNDSLSTLEDIMQIGTNSKYAKDRLVRYAAKNDRWGKGPECLDAYNDENRKAFREAIENAMDSLQIDAIVYPTWNQKPARIDRFEEEYGGDNNQIIAPHTGQPAFTVPMGFMQGNLPAGLQFLGRMYAEPTLIKLAYAYEQGTKHRKVPNLSMPKKKVIFVCTHGAARSPIASVYFNKMAEEAGLNYTSIFRGIKPDVSITAETVYGLAEDGFVMKNWQPKLVTIDEVSTAKHIVTFDCEVSGFDQMSAKFQQWDSISPISKNYGVARDTILLKVEKLIEQLKLEVK